MVMYSIDFCTCIRMFAHSPKPFASHNVHLHDIFALLHLFFIVSWFIRVKVAQKDFFVE